MKTSSLFAALLVAVTLAGCGQTKVASPYGTSLFITTRWNSQAAPVSVLYIVGMVDGRDAFPSTFRPEQIPAKPLSGPQTVRVLLADDIVGQAVQVTVYAYDRNGELEMSGTATSAPVVAADEVTVQVLLDQPFDGGVELVEEDAGAHDAGEVDAGLRDAGAEVDAGAVDGGAVDAGSTDAGARDAGSVDAGLADAGVPDAGAPDAGPPPTCNCATTCCTGKAATCATPAKVPIAANTALTVAGCGVAGGTCTAACDPLLADSCQGGHCTCGGSICKPGQRCTAGGCVCDTLSNCAGCCDNNICVTSTPRPAQLCGAAGEQCRGCPGNQVCSAAGLCTDPAGPAVSVLCGAGNCHSADQCYPSSFPTCRASAPAAAICAACDAVRSDRCSLNGNDCACGLGARCSPTEYCDRSIALTPVCKPLPF